MSIRNQEQHTAIPKSHSHDHMATCAVVALITCVSDAFQTLCQSFLRYGVHR